MLASKVNRRRENKSDKSDKIEVMQTKEEALKDTLAPLSLQKRLVLVCVPFFDFDFNIQTGTLIVLDNLEKEVKHIFAQIYRAKFPIAKIRPMTSYGWSDEKSRNDNNTSGFNYRSLEGFPELLSWHAFGCALDINPLQNPATMPDALGKIYKTRGSYDRHAKGTLLPEGPVVKAFREQGWHWGGNYKDKKDYQHFEKPLKDTKLLERLLES